MQRDAALGSAWAERGPSGGPLTRPSVLLALAITVILTACGTGTSGQAGRATDDRPCSEVHAELEEANRVRNETFGAGPDGREAMETIRRATEERPDCFDADPTIVSGFDLLPAGTEDAARMVADACDGGTEITGVINPEAEPADSPEDALAEARDRLPAGRLPDGEPTRSTEHADGVGFDLSVDGEYRGWVLVAEVNHGWLVHLAIACA